jgi:tetratricopeptide (TPR) repeat protein
VINSNGVDFALTDDTRRQLIAAGARPDVIRAVADNPRFDTTTAKNQKSNRKQKTTLADYEDLIDQAMFSYKDEKNPAGAVRFLETAVKMNPKKPEAYQMLGFVNLYGLNNAARAEKMMREAIENGGSAVFRVYHDDTGSFNGRCTGSLYISPETIRFESDDNRHTFETSISNIDKLKLDTESNRNWKKHTVFKVFLRIGKEDVKFRFAPVSGNEAESEMVERFVYISKNNIAFTSIAAIYYR